MQYIGRIITKSKNVETIDFVEVTDNKSLIEDCTIPTLIIGKKNVEELVGKENVRFLDKKISNNLYWTFAKTEQRNEYEKDLKSFNNMLINKLINNVQYKFFNIFTESLARIKQLIRFINSTREKIIYISNNMLYIYYENKVCGVSLTDLSYIGVKRDKVLKKLKSNSYNKIITNDYFLTNAIKKQINSSKILIPYMYFLENT